MPHTIETIEIPKGLWEEKERELRDLRLLHRQEQAALRAMNIAVEELLCLAQGELLYPPNAEEFRHRLTCKVLERMGLLREGD